MNILDLEKPSCGSIYISIISGADLQIAYRVWENYGSPCIYSDSSNNGHTVCYIYKTHWTPYTENVEKRASTITFKSAVISGAALLKWLKALFSGTCSTDSTRDFHVCWTLKNAFS